MEVLCRSLDDVDKSTNNSILMTAEGKLMVLGQTIASYSAGTVSDRVGEGLGNHYSLLSL